MNFRWRRIVLYTAIALFLVLCVGLRTVALESDPYARLSWSSGLLTDEGYYIHNARNEVLFGRARTDDFNNMLIMPTLHVVQVAVFRIWGVGAVQARLISVVMSLLCLPVLFGACRRAFGMNVACWAALFLGLDHINLLYNRMALMDTPGAFLLVCGFYAWVRAASGDTTPDKMGRFRVWLFISGAVLATAFVTRGLCAAVIPVPIVLLAYRLLAGSTVSHVEPVEAARFSGISSSRWFPLISFLAGLGIVLMVYGFVWYLPHRQELIQVNRYYVGHQLVPHNVSRLILNIGNGWFGDERGMAPFYMRHSPIVLLLGLAWIVLGRKVNFGTGDSERFILLWIVFFVGCLSVVNYAPSRYFLIVNPAIAVAAALALGRASELLDKAARHAVFLPMLCGYIAYHLGLVLWHHADLPSSTRVGMLTVTGAVVGFLLRRGLAGNIGKNETWGTRLRPVVLLAWGLINGYFLIDWRMHLTYAQRDADRQLAALFRPDTVLIGDVAPGICLNNRFLVVSVIPGLCNDREPVERFALRPRAIVILDEGLKERWWREHYPRETAATSRTLLFPDIVRFPIGIYKVKN